MICYPNAKINLGLKIISKRDDNYHNIESFFLPIPLFDILEVKKQMPNITDTTISYSGFNTHIINNDLVIEAFNILKNDFPIDPIRVHLHKNIPFQSGLGGGSSDAAFMLIMLNKLFNLDLSELELFNYAKNLGSDCPFFIINQFSQVSSNGDVIKPINFNFDGYYIVILKPDVSCSTRDIFSKYHLNKKCDLLIKFDKNPIYWKKELVNDLESVTFSIHPELKDIKNYLYNKGAIYASMSGSGSSVYGIFNTKPNIDQKFNYWYWEGSF